MADRPLGMTIASGFFVLIGLASALSGLGSFALWSELPPGQPLSVQVFVYVIPFFLLGLGVAGVVAGVGLWNAQPYGRTAGLVWTALWVGEEVLIGVWATVGPDVVQEASSGLGANLLRVVAGALLFYYLWTTGEAYVEG